VAAAAELSSIVLSIVVAPTKDVDTSAWFSLAGVGHAALDYLTVMLGVAGWAVFGSVLAVIFRSAPSRWASGSPGPVRSRTSSSTRGAPATGSSRARSSAR
jgi:hypothetical protein